MISPAAKDAYYKKKERIAKALIKDLADKYGY
jgi:hypothetical protein